MESIEEMLEKFLISNGYGRVPAPTVRFPETYRAYYTKAVATKNLCSCNESEPQFLVEVLTISVHTRTEVIVSMFIRGADSNGTWFSLDSYSMGYSDIRERLEEIETKLTNCWNSLWS